MEILQLLKTQPAKDGFKYWFKPVYKKLQDKLEIYELASNDNNQTMTIVGLVEDKDKGKLDLLSQRPDKNEILQDLLSYRDRIECAAFDVFYDKQNRDIDRFEYMLVAGILLAELKVTDRQVESTITWIRSTDFYTAPASTMYHDAKPGGLLKHTLNVLGNTLELLQVDAFKDANIGEAIIAACCHDFCKIGMYDAYLRNVKDDKLGIWKQVQAYKYKEQRYVEFGHGASSMYLVLNMLPISKECALAIRWHMGEYNVAHNEMNELHQANVYYPLVQLIQFADRLSITNYANKY